MKTLSYDSKFADINGIRLHYLDWGGSGAPLLFLAGFGCSAHIFTRIAHRFSNKFHVMALTRRGHGESDAPDTGYDRDTLVDDILDFIELKNLDKVTLAGHSFAGYELTYFAEKFPEKVSKLIYLDASYDRIGGRKVISLLETIDPPDYKEEFNSPEEYVSYMKHMGCEILSKEMEASILQQFPLTVPLLA